MNTKSLHPFVYLFGLALILVVAIYLTQAGVIDLSIWAADSVDLLGGKSTILGS